MAILLSVLFTLQSKVDGTLATYFFHDFWTLSDPQARQEQMIQFMKNLGLMGAMLIVIANGTGPMSLDRRKGGA